VRNERTAGCAALRYRAMDYGTAMDDRPAEVDVIHDRLHQCAHLLAAIRRQQ